MLFLLALRFWNLHEKGGIIMVNRKEKRAWEKRYIFLMTLVSMVLLIPAVVYAEGTDPLTTINNLSSFVFSAIKAIGVIILGWGVVQIGLSLQSHDASQRSNGFLTFFGGLVIAFAKEILDLIL